MAGGGTQSLNITNSAITKYLGSRVILTTDPDSANKANTTLDSLFRCPSDNIESRPNAKNNGGKLAPERYSYSLNSMFAYPVKAVGTATAAPSDKPAFDAGARDFNANKSYGLWTFHGKLTEIRKPSDHILLVDEDEQSIDDAACTLNPQAMNGQGTAFNNSIAARHEMRFKKTATAVSGGTTEDARGNVPASAMATANS